VYEEQHGRCPCGAPAVELDHIVPVAWGGTDDRSNTVMRCIPCHRARTQQQAAEGRRRRAAVR
jgi:5-methylcytosine-specific restriction protein A